MSNILPAVTNAAYAAVIGFIATESGIATSSALEHPERKPLIAEIADGLSQTIVLSTGAMLGVVGAVGMLRTCFASETPFRVLVQLIERSLQEDRQFGSQIAVMASLGTAMLTTCVGEAVKALTSEKDAIEFKVAAAITIVSLMALFSRVNRVALQNIAIGSFVAEIAGILLSNALPSFLPKAWLSGGMAGAGAGLLTLIRG